jgi:hypothetical protein
VNRGDIERVLASGMTRDKIIERIADQLGIDPEDEEALAEEGIILFDGMERAFVGLAERFEPVTRVTVTADNLETDTQEVGGTHRYFAVYSYRKMVNILRGPFGRDMSREDAIEYLEFNTVGLYAGPNTPAILRDLE